MVVEFSGRTAVVTGGSGSIGSVCVKTLLESGAKVAIIDVNEARINAVVSDLASCGEVKGYAADLTDVDSIAPLIEKIRSEMGEISLLLQCAGLMGGTPGLKVQQDEWERFMNVNSRALFFVMQQIVEQSMQHTGGSVVNLASMSGIRGMRIPMCSATYSASKGAVVALSMQAAVEWAPLNVRVNVIAPGGVETPPMRQRGVPADAIEPIPLKKLNQPEDIANTAAFLLSDKAATITGQTIVVDGGASIVGY